MHNSRLRCNYYSKETSIVYFASAMLCKHQKHTKALTRQQNRANRNEKKETKEISYK